MRRLIAVLLDEAAARKALAEALVVERAFNAEGMRRQAQGTWAIRPLSDRQQLRWLDGFSILIEAAKEPNYEAARRVTSRLDADWELKPSSLAYRLQVEKVPRYSRWFDFGGPRATANAIMVYYRHSAERRVAAVALAVRLYRIDRGRWPDALADLVPDYLAAVPTDPFQDGERPLGYLVQRGVLPDGGDRPLVYFDAGGSEAAIDSEPMYGWQHEPRVNDRVPTRQYRDLALWLPTTRRFDEARRLAAEAVEDDPEEPDAPGDDEQDGDEADDPADE